MIKLIDDSIAELKPKNEAPKPPSSKAPSPPPSEQKWSRENHPAFKKAGSAEDKEKEKEPEMVYQVNDNVMAKWVSGDKGFYPARITAVTGSSTAPIYTVKFKNYDTVETLRAKDIRPVAQKRKADGTAVSGTASAIGGAASSAATPSPSSLTPTSSNNGIVLMAAADIYPQAQAANKAAADKNDDKPRPKFKKIKATKELEAGKNKWQEFTSKGKIGKALKKESMFRTPEGIHGRGTYMYLFLFAVSSSRPRHANVSSQSASPALARPCAKILREPAMSTSPTMIWTRLTRLFFFFVFRNVVTAWYGPAMASSQTQRRRRRRRLAFGSCEGGWPPLAGVWVWDESG